MAHPSWPSDNPDRNRDQRPGMRRKLTAAMIIGALMVSLVVQAPPSEATHTTITGSSLGYFPYQQTWNGYRVYLSAPRHGDSGNRGELGWEENINGRHWNWYAANGDYWAGSYNTSYLFRNIRARSYEVTVSGNLRDDGHIAQAQASNNWGSDVFIVTHTNACCSGNYFLSMYSQNLGDTNDSTLATKMGDFVGAVVPGTINIGTDVQFFGGPLGELNVTTPNTIASVYNELFFHDNQNQVNWFGSGTNWSQSVTTHAWRYGIAVDQTLGYPRAV